MSETHGAGEQGFARFLPADPRVAPTAGAQVRPAQAASAPPARRPPPHLTRVLLAHESRGRLLGQAALVQPQPLHVAVGGDTLSLSGAVCRDSLSDSRIERNFIQLSERNFHLKLKLDKEKVQSPYPVTFSPLEGWCSKRRLLFGPFLEGKSLNRDLYSC